MDYGLWDMDYEKKRLEIKRLGIKKFLTKKNESYSFE